MSPLAGHGLTDHTWMNIGRSLKSKNQPASLGSSVRNLREPPQLRAASGQSCRRSLHQLGTEDHGKEGQRPLRKTEMDLPAGRSAGSHGQCHSRPVLSASPCVLSEGALATLITRSEPHGRVHHEIMVKTKIIGLTLLGVSKRSIIRTKTFSQILLQMKAI